MSDTDIAIHAERVRLSSGGHRILPAITFDAAVGSIVALVGASGTGKTSLLLALAGRMRGWNGSIRVFGADAARDGKRVRQLVGLGLMPGINDLSPALTPAQHVAEQRAFAPRSQRSPRTDVLARVRLDAAASIQVKLLDAEQCVRLGIALALVRDVRVLVVDDLDRDLDAEQRGRVVALLRELADEGLTVLVACVDEATASEADMVVAVSEPDAAPAHTTTLEVPADALA